MRTEAIWDKWMEYDDEEFCLVLRQDAPEDVKKAYERHCAETEKSGSDGYVAK